MMKATTAWFRRLSAGMSWESAATRIRTTMMRSITFAYALGRRSFWKKRRMSICALNE